MSDWGVGIEKGWEEAVFSHKVRAPNALKLSVTGQGIGLWVVRQIIEMHGGRVSVTRLADPTEFTITLPADLETRTPDAGGLNDSVGD